MRKKLVVCCDGTWNDPADKTHIHAIAHGLEDSDADGNPQHVFYQEGVGTAYGEYIRGGVFGAGLSENIREAYHWLVDQYQDGDDIFCFGFSRGAYTARSLGGFIAYAGLIEPSATTEATERRIESLYDGYREQADPTPEPAVYQPNIRFLGVFDTVGALGVPIGWMKQVGKWFGISFEFHDTSLCERIECACHALSVDEKREPFAPTLWSGQPGEIAGKPGKIQELHQVWFTGVHSDVGGGYKEKELSRIPLMWMLEHAQTCGLRVKPHLIEPLTGDEHKQHMHNSMKLGWKIVHGILPSMDTYRRPIGNAARRKAMGDKWVEGKHKIHREAVHRSVFDRRATSPNELIPDEEYQPKNLKSFEAPDGDLLVLDGD